MTDAALQLPPEAIHDALDVCMAHSIASSSETENAIEALIKEAKHISDEYFKVFSNTSGQDGKDIGAMMPSVKIKTSTNGSTLEIRWIRSIKGPEQRIRNTINKGSGAGYSIPKLIRKSPDWEKELITEAENQFTAIRDMYSILIKNRFSDRAMKKAINKYNKAFA